MESLIIGIAAAFNLLVIKKKFDHKRWADGILDMILLIILSRMFGETGQGMIIATIGSAIISVALFVNPPKLPLPDNFFEEFKKRMPK